MDQIAADPAVQPAAIVTVGEGAHPVSFGNHLPLAVIAGPCQIESAASCKATAHSIA